MTDGRNEYGFPTFVELFDACVGQAEVASKQKEDQQALKLERAHSIAAEVRARRFPSVQRITPKD